MPGRLFIVGLGPGAEDLQTPQAYAAIQTASELFGYTTYLDRVPLRPDQIRHASDNREELARARAALESARSGKSVAIVSSGDPGVFAMASAVFEAIEFGDPAWRGVEVMVVPGVSAMFAAAARIGAPLGHDFCAISLSDNLKPWRTVLRRLKAAAEADFVIALYNAVSKARPDRLGEALDVLRRYREPATPVIFATAVSRDDEAIDIVSLADAGSVAADMRTLVLVGSSATRLVTRPGAPPWVYTPRRAEECVS
jgi:precorrin-3B C17-methyltransferase